MPLPRRDNRSEEAKAPPRLRGRAGMKQRARRLQAEPLCRDCAAAGRVTPSYTPDHIIPLTNGGPDTDDNIRCLCKPCHEARTAEQFGFRKVVGADKDGWPVT